MGKKHAKKSRKKGTSSKKSGDKKKSKKAKKGGRKSGARRKAVPRASAMARTAEVSRQTLETDITVRINLDGIGRSNIDTGLPFFDHMLGALSKHSLIDIDVRAIGDLEVDPHHTVEDVGLCLGRALVDAVGDRAGMVRYGDAALPFDEALILAHVDLGGRAFFSYEVEITPGRCGTFDVELAEVFFQALATEGRMNLHLVKGYGSNRHHIIEGCFKSLARALEKAVKIDPRRHSQVASTKGLLD